MELRHLRYFVMVADELHFGHAAERLHMAQPPLSRQIAELEGELKVQLLHRTKRRVMLTPAGSVFLERARRVLTMADEAVAVARRLNSGMTGSIRIGFVGSAMYTEFPSILRRYRQQYPDVELLLFEMNTDEQVKGLLERQIDIGFLRSSVQEASLAAEIVFHDTLVAALPEGHHLSHVSVIPVRLLLNEPLILYPRALNRKHDHHILTLCSAVGITPKVIQESEEIQTALGLVSAALGVTIVPGSAQNLPWPGVVYRRLTDPSPTTEMHVAYRRDELFPPLAQFLSYYVGSRDAVKRVAGNSLSS